LKPRIVSATGTFAFEAGELLRDEEGLGEEPLDLAGTRHGELVVFRQFVDAENRDDVLEILVALQDLLHAAGDVVVLVAEDARVENAQVESVDRRRGKFPAPRSARQVLRGIQVRRSSPGAGSV
jgi:hypothetical protein